MAETIEERLEDLERLVLRQSERIDELEEKLALASRLAVQKARQALDPDREAA